MSGNLNWPLIHKEFNNYSGKVGNAQPPTPQPEAVSPMHAMIVHAMSQTQAKPGEDHGSMILRAMSEHLKRLTPDVSKIHVQPSTQQGA